MKKKKGFIRARHDNAISNVRDFVSEFFYDLRRCFGMKSMVNETKI